LEGAVLAKETFGSLKRYFVPCLWLKAIMQFNYKWGFQQYPLRKGVEGSGHKPNQVMEFYHQD
jgi:hypothetical protein